MRQDEPYERWTREDIEALVALTRTMKDSTLDDSPEVR